MTEYKLEITGSGIRDKHTHYEVSSSIGPEKAIVTIRGDIAVGFQNKYKIPITKAEELQITVDLYRNDERVKDCQDLYRPASILMGAVYSLDDIVYTRK